MCGICGFIDFRSGVCDPEEVIAKMLARLVHRGPDDEGFWSDHSAGIFLGHRRLAILDLSPSGHQPMSSHDGRFTIVYNGEVYNFLTLRKELEDLGHKFRGSSDTEVILASISQWGVEGAVKRFNGMFAFAVWDNKERTLYLVRDRIGIKPLYYGWVKDSFVFASELKPFYVFPGFERKVDRKALALFLKHNCVPAPISIFCGVKKLLPGYIVRVSKGEKDVKLERYWSAFETACQGLQDPFEEGEQDAVEELHELLMGSVGYRMISDVPLGAFLSGGIDSSTVVALMQAQSSQPVKTFSIGNTYSQFDEAQDAAKVANYLGTDHTELYVTPKEAMEIIPALPAIYDEPFADSSQIPTFIVSRLARQSVTVALSGDGGDELFGGYNRHLWAPKIWGKVGWLSFSFRRIIADFLSSFSPEFWDSLFVYLKRIAPAAFGHRNPGYKLQKLAEVLRAVSVEDIYPILTSHWHNTEALVLELEEEGKQYIPFSLQDLPDFEDFLMLADLVTYLPNDILTKVDRASMAVSLEARVPILDHRVVEFAWRLPLRFKLRNGQSKWILRQVLFKYVPPGLVERPKSGFGVPIEHWLRGPLREWAEALLDRDRLIKEGFFDPEPICRKWEEHLQGKHNWAYLLWDVLMFQAWLEEHNIA